MDNYRNNRGLGLMLLMLVLGVFPQPFIGLVQMAGLSAP
jgi:hypothetical protein